MINQFYHARMHAVHDPAAIEVSAHADAPPPPGTAPLPHCAQVVICPLCLHLTHFFVDEIPHGQPVGCATCGTPLLNTEEVQLRLESARARLRAA